MSKRWELYKKLDRNKGAEMSQPEIPQHSEELSRKEYGKQPEGQVPVKQGSSFLSGCLLSVLFLALFAAAGYGYYVYTLQEARISALRDEVREFKDLVERQQGRMRQLADGIEENGTLVNNMRADIEGLGTRIAGLEEIDRGMSIVQKKTKQIEASIQQQMKEINQLRMQVHRTAAQMDASAAPAAPSSPFPEALKGLDARLARLEAVNVSLADLQAAIDRLKERIAGREGVIVEIREDTDTLYRKLSLIEMELKLLNKKVRLNNAEISRGR
ncbi:MAG: hypothetical protein GF333_00615 [Candidatus Omnitrophica bacterium]|nr:hypothetical protein [Candidatus Omnitrophota bacterium]